MSKRSSIQKTFKKTKDFRRKSRRVVTATLLKDSILKYVRLITKLSNALISILPTILGLFVKAKEEKKEVIEVEKDAA